MRLALPIRATVVRRTREILDVPLVRNAYSLVGATLVTSVLGVVFWIVAAHAFSTADVGTDAALISAMMFLSRVGQLNLASGFNRFVPTAGGRRRRLVLLGYAASITVAVVAAAIFVAGIGMWAPRLSILSHEHWRAAWFVAATAVWTIFVLQDSVLTGLGEAQWVLWENAAYGIFKLFALLAFAALLPHAGVFVAWTAPLIVLVLPVNRLLFRRLIPARHDEALEAVDARAISRYISVDFVASTLVAATSGLMPLVVLATLDARASAYLYLAWTMAYTVHVLSENVGMSFITEASRDPERIVDYARKTLAHALRIVVPLAAVLALGAPLVLRAFGTDYASHATRLLQLLAISAIPNAIVNTYLSVARVQRRMGRIVAVTSVQSVTIFAVATVLLHVVGLTGVGLAWLLTQTSVATVLVFGEFRTLWLPYLSPAALHDVADRGRALPRRHATRASAALARERMEESGLVARGWETAGAGIAGTDTYTVPLRSRTDGTEGMLKIGTTVAGVDSLRRRLASLQLVRAGAPPDFGTLVPTVFETGPEQDWVLESRRPGLDARGVVQPVNGSGPHGPNGNTTRLLRDLHARMNTLYGATARSTLVDEETIGVLVEDPVCAMRGAAAQGAVATHVRALSDAKSIDRARAELREQLAGVLVTTAVVHGNLWLGNVLWEPASGAVTGIVDWTRIAPGIPIVDAAHLAISTVALEERHEFGTVVRELLQRDRWPDREAELLASVPGSTDISRRAVILLAWLSHVAGKGPSALGNHVWVAHNVHQVLESL